MRVTIIADASHCGETKVAGYGFWIASDRGKRNGGGAFKKGVSGALAAEMMALVNGVHQAKADGLLCHGDYLLLQTDSQGAICTFKGERQSPLKKDEWAAKNKMEQLTQGITVRFKHVKGHSRFKDNRHASNRHCDRIAGIEMRKARKALRVT